MLAYWFGVVRLNVGSDYVEIVTACVNAVSLYSSKSSGR